MYVVYMSSHVMTQIRIIDQVSFTFTFHCSLIIQALISTVSADSRFDSWKHKGESILINQVHLPGSCVDILLDFVGV